MKARAMMTLFATIFLSMEAMGMTDWQPVGEGRLEIRTAQIKAPSGDAFLGNAASGNVPVVAPLRHTDVRITVRGSVAEATVTQVFENPLDRPIEAEYVFPLPQNAAVNHSEMRIGERIVKGRIEKRAEARQTYEQARDQGKRASLLEQERPNIFTQSVANIGPMETIRVVIRYVQPLEYVDGNYLVVFPMVVGPRYIPGQETGGVTGNGRMPDTDQVPDASRITPSVIRPGERCGFDIDIRVDIDAGVPIQDIRSRSHQIAVNRTGESVADVSLDQADRIPNKDFVLAIACAGKQPEVGVLSHHNGKSGYFMLILHPPEMPALEQIRPREVFLVLDSSGSMDGQPIRIVKQAAEKLLSELRPDDRFNIWSFNQRANAFQRDPVLADAQNVGAGAQFIQRMTANGGTEMITGIQAALSTPAPEDYIRIVVLFTDGYIGNDDTIIREAGRLLGPARLFSFGVGSSVNRYLLDRLAEIGRGKADYILLNDSPDEAITRFADRLSKPVLTDVSVNWGNAKAIDMIPSYVPDVYAGMPVYVFGRYDKPGQIEIGVAGRIGPEPSLAKITVDLAGPGELSSPLPSIWAREQIQDLELAGARSGNKNRAKITELALEYQLMSAYTSFVAVDETASDGVFGKPEFVPVSVPMPDGVNYEMTVQEKKSGSGRPVQVPVTASKPVHVAKKNVPVQNDPVPVPVKKEKRSRPYGIRFGGGGPVGPFAMLVVAALGVAKLRARKKNKRA